MLFDSEITEFMHEENVVCVAADAVYYLTLAAGLPGEKILRRVIKSIQPYKIVSFPPHFVT